MESLSSYGPFSAKMSRHEVLKSKMEVETINKALQKDGQANQKVMGKDEFLKLLVTELQHQDPSNPMKDREFIAQMAQFSSLEQMLNMNKGIEKLVDNVSFQSSFNLLGKQVAVNNTALQGEEMQTITGTVESVSRGAQEVMIGINGEQYPLSSVTKVED